MNRRILVVTLGLLLSACNDGRSKYYQTPATITRDVPSVYGVMQQYYLHPENLPPESQVSSVSSLIAALNDPFTFELSPPQAAQTTNGTNQGAYGLSVAHLSTFIYVNAVDPSGPAWQAGLRRNDVVRQIGTLVLTDTTTDTEIVNALAPQSLTMSVTRGPTPLSFSMTRASFTSTSVEEESIDATTHYTRIDHFVETSVDPRGPTGELEKILQRNTQKTHWVLDLRWNTGGFLDRAAEIADLFIPNGRVLEMRDRTGAVVTFTDAVPGGPGEGKQLVVLVNALSASSSEVVTAAVRSLNAGKAVGDKTFGKGVSQRVFQYPDGGQLLLVSFQLFDANGSSWHGVGITPDVVQPLDPQKLLDGHDSQLEAALNVLGVPAP